MSGLVFHLIAHTHWDREWYLPQAAFQARLVPMLDELLARLSSDPGYHSFLLDGQTVLVEDYLRVRPTQEPLLRSLVKAGRLQVGPWYVLADELIPSGESLVRNLLLGAADAERLGGRLDVLYSPDAFGHPAAWPSLAREFGIKFGALWRGLGGEPGQERDLYRWTGPDGRDVLLWHFPPAGYEIGAALAADAVTLPAAWRAVREALVARAAGKHVPVFIGADHHAAHPDLTRLRDLLAGLEPDHAVRVSRLDEFFQGAAAEAAAAPLSGELRWSYRYTWTLQGVQGTRLQLKRRNSELEVTLERFVEPLTALARRRAGARGEDRRPLLEATWRALIRGQFHDVLAGCCADSVAAAAAVRLESVGAAALELARAALYDLVGHDPDQARERRDAVTPALVLWNPAVRPRGGVVVADVTVFRRDIPVGPPRSDTETSTRPERRGATPSAFALRAGQTTVPVQVLARRVTTERIDAARHYPDTDEVDQLRVAFRAPAVPGLGIAMLEPAPRPPNVRADHGGVERVEVRGRSLINRQMEVTLEATGALALHDRRSGERYFDLLRLEDGGDAGDAYTFSPVARDRVVRAAGPIKVRRLAGGPLVAALEARYKMKGVVVRLLVTLHADSPIVRCVLELENRALNHRVRARAPLAIAGAAAVAGAAFGTVVRPPVAVQRDHYSLETPVPTAPAHRFVAAADGRRGLALLVPGFMEYEWTARGEVVVTLLRAIGELSRGDLPTRPGHAGWPTPIPAAQCQGRHRIELALTPVSTGDLERGDIVPAMWEDVFAPPRGVWLRDAGVLAPATSDVMLEGSGLVVSAIKPAQAGSGIILRCYNATSRQVGGAWRFGEGVKTAHRLRADERESTALVLEQRGRVVRFAAGPHEIVTILVT